MMTRTRIADQDFNQQKFVRVQIAILIFLGLLLGGVCTPVQAQVVANLANGHYYEAISVAQGIDWVDARDEAANRSYLGRRGHLATLTSAAEVQFVLNNFPTADSDQYWLGGYQDRSASDYSEPAGGWRWVTGEPWSYTNWSVNQPDNYLGVEDSLQLFNHSGAWNDGKGTGLVAGYVVEYEFSTLPFDLNGDGHSDLLLQNASIGQIISWFMNGSTFLGGAYFSLNPPTDYTLVGAGDFGGAGRGIPTLVFQSQTTNQIIYWYTGGINAATITGGDYANVQVPAGWKVVGISDFNGDGKSDLVVQNQTTYQIAIYFMSGAYYQGGVLLPYNPPVGWKVVGVGDFNGDGFPDIAFQIQSTGQIALWYMNGTTYFNGLVMPSVPPVGWKVVAVGDYNGDGIADLVFQSPTSNQGMLWYLTPTGGLLGSALLSTKAPAGWNFAGPH